MGLHRQAVDTLESQYGDAAGPHLAELAYHAIAGSEFAKGLDYATRAGDRARSLLAYEEAARLYEMALDALDVIDRSDTPIRCELLLSTGDSRDAGGQSQAAKEAFLEAAELAERAGLRRELARAAAGYGGRNSWARAGTDHRLVPLLEAGLSAVANDDIELRARLLARLAGALRDEHSRTRRDALSAEAVELARRTGNPLARSHMRSTAAPQRSSLPTPCRNASSWLPSSATSDRRWEIGNANSPVTGTGSLRFNSSARPA